MPTNKNAFIRYKYLDRLLSDHHHYYDIHDLIERVNQKLYDDGLSEVTRRCIEKDIHTLEYAPFSAPIERRTIMGKHIIRYSRASFSIFSKEMSDEEANLLREVLNTIGQFDGLDNFTWLDDFKIGLGLEERRQIISFSNNPYLKNSNLLSTLFDQISNEVVVRLSYHTFTNPDVRSIVLHPYLLKEYNNRWFVIGAADSDNHILTYALDRIDSVEPLPGQRYKPCPDNLSDRFVDIVGVTFIEGTPVEHILLWASDHAKGYVLTKPIHGSQKHYQGEREEQLRAEYPQLEGGAFFSIDCIKNFELIRQLCSYGSDLVVLRSDGTIADDIYRRICQMKDIYDLLEERGSFRDKR